MAGFIDIHTHLNFLDKSVEEVLIEAQAAGVERVITIGTEPGDLPVVLDLAEKYRPTVHCTIGVHPHEAKKYDEETERFIREQAVSDRVVAIGEIGLDYHYMMSERETQLKVFESQLEIAADLQMPVQVHTRDAEEDTEEIVRRYQGRVRGVFHCFTGSLELAKVALDVGWNISFSGILTFRNAQELRDVAKYIPLDRLHFETDAPYLTPVPLRGKANFPCHVVHTAKLLAEIKGIELSELCQQVKKNALSLFPKLSWA